MRKIPLLLLILLSTRPSFSASLVPEHVEHRLSNGVRSYFFPNAKLPLFQVEILFKSGARFDADKKSGATIFTAAMLKKGVSGKSEEQISSELDDMAAGIDFDVSDETIRVSLYGLKKYAERVLKLFESMLFSATFDEKPFSRIKKNQLQSIAHLSDSASAMAGHVFDLVLYNGTDLARPIGGRYADVERLEVNDLRQRMKEMLFADGAEALVIGGSGQDEVFDKVKVIIERLKSRSGEPSVAPKKYFDPRFESKPGTLLVVDRPGVSEAHLRMGFLGPSRLTPDYHALRVAETALSANYGSRLNMELREKLQLSYGVSAAFSFGSEKGNFTVATSCESKDTGAMVAKLRAMLGAFAQRGIDETELGAAKAFLVGAFPMSLQNMFSIASVFFNGKIQGLDDDFLDAYREKVSKLSLENVNSAIKKHFLLSEMKEIVVGDRIAIEKSLKKSGIRQVSRSYEDFL